MPCLVHGGSLIRPELAILALLLLQVGCTNAKGQADEAATGGANLVNDGRNWRAIIDKSAADFEFLLAGPPPTPLKPLPAAALRWSNLPRSTTDGATFLYTHKGRPEAVLCFYNNIGDGRLFIMAGSLSQTNVQVKFQGQATQKTLRPALTFHDAADLPPPAQTPDARLLQMQGLASAFNLVLLHSHNAPDPPLKLTLRANPIYRYQSEIPELVDGAVFAFVLDTDPEALLLCEAVKTGDETRWLYAFARRTGWYTEARLRGRVVWRAGSLQEDDPDASCMGGELPIAR